MTQAQAQFIDINADVGEGAGYDADLMPLISSANIACGGHASDDAMMAEATVLARKHGVAIGAHPGHPDRDHFGRREIFVTPAAAAALVVDQVGRLERVAGETPRHVKLHGGLYHQVANDAGLAIVVTEAIAARWPGMRLITPAGSQLARVACDRGLAVATEAFIDRGYSPNGMLVPRSEPGAIIIDPDEAAARGVQLACERTVTAVDGTRLAITADTLCIHGDGPNAVGIATAVRAALAAAGIAVRPPGGFTRTLS